MILIGGVVFFFDQKKAYESRISDLSSDVCSSDLPSRGGGGRQVAGAEGEGAPARAGEDDFIDPETGDGEPADRRRIRPGPGPCFGDRDSGEPVLQCPFQQDRKSTRLNSSH